MTSQSPAPTAPLYQELPYPADGVIRTTVARMLRRGLVARAPHLISKPNLHIVDVGCGTGEATCGLARMFPTARVVGVDINLPSLELSRKLAQRHGLDVPFVEANITENLEDAVRQANVMKGQDTFDVVTSMGVLHHLSDPAAGFAAVRGLIQPDGLFLGYIYSRTGCWDGVVVRSLLDSGLKDASFQDRARAVGLLRLSRKHTLVGFLSTLRRRLRFGPPLSPIEMLKVQFRRNRLTHMSDSFSNPCRHEFLFSDLHEVFEQTGWTFLALAEQGGMPVTPEQHTKNPETLRLLRNMPPATMYDYFAWHYRYAGFTFFLKPSPTEGAGAGGQA